MKKIYLLCIALVFVALSGANAQQLPAMYFSDTSRLGRPVAKDPKVIWVHRNQTMSR